MLAKSSPEVAGGNDSDSVIARFTARSRTVWHRHQVGPKS